MMKGDNMHWGTYGYGWGMGFGWMGMLLFWGLLIAGTVYFIRTAVKKETTCVKEESALEILKKRFAKGEITKDDFTRMKDDLAKS
jgi:putative membrane protein